MLTFLVFISGLIIGRFLNVCIYRIPRGESVVYPPSHCPTSGKRLSAWELIPVLSHFFLKGRCDNCKTQISFKYVVVELLTGLLFVWMYLWAGPGPKLINYLLLVSILVVVTFIDLEYYLIPNKVLFIGAVLQLTINLFTHQIAYLDAVTGFIVGGGPLLIIAAVKKDGMGGGDIKLAAVLGLFLGWQKIFQAFFVATVIGTIIVLFMIMSRKKGFKDIIPFGPFLAAGTILTLLWGDFLTNWYLGLFF